MWRDGGAAISPCIPANQRFDRAAEGVVLRDEGAEEVEEWYFEKLTDSRIRNGRLEYKVKWPHPHRATWEPMENVAGADGDIRDFHLAHPDKPGPEI